jgi:hypothetical protein
VVQIETNKIAASEANCHSPAKMQQLALAQAPLNLEFETDARNVGASGFTKQSFWRILKNESKATVRPTWEAP